MRGVLEKLRFQTLSRPMRMGMFFSIGAVRKCSSIS